MISFFSRLIPSHALLRREMIRHDMCHVLIWILKSNIYDEHLFLFLAWVEHEKNLSKMLLRLSFSFILVSTLSHVAVSRDDTIFQKIKKKLKDIPFLCNKDEMKL